MMGYFTIKAVYLNSNWLTFFKLELTNKMNKLKSISIFWCDLLTKIFLYSNWFPHCFCTTEKNTRADAQKKDLKDLNCNTSTMNIGIKYTRLKSQRWSELTLWNKEWGFNQRPESMNLLVSELKIHGKTTDVITAA
jgi:hypothetical protein